MQIRKIEEKCNECMLCVKDCAAGVWREDGQKSALIDPESCNRCSHCLSVCPQGAIEHDVLDSKQIRRTDKKQMDPEVYNEIVTSRRSIRHYKDKPVPREIIQKILDLARYSPTASNSQNVGYIIIQDRAIIQKVSKEIFGFSKRIFKFTRSSLGKFLLGVLKNISIVSTINRYIGTMDYNIQQTDAGRDFILHHAPVLILIHAPKGAKFSCDNCNIAAVNIINYAHVMGLGTCFIGFLSLALGYSRYLRNLLGIPKNRKVFTCMVIGFPAYRHSFTASRKQPDVRWIQ